MIPKLDIGDGRGITLTTSLVVAFQQLPAVSSALKVLDPSLEEKFVDSDELRQRVLVKVAEDVLKELTNP